MKSRTFWKWTLGVSLGALPFAGGCLQETNDPPPTQTAAAITTVAQTSPASEAALGGGAFEAEVPELTNLIDAVVQPVSTNLPPPAKVTLTAPAAELVRMAGSGVQESVMLAYVTNSASTFNLGADEIIYMNDLGVPGPVITAMIQRDQAIKTAAAAALVAASQPATDAVPAPTGPAPADVAPQVAAPEAAYTAPTEPPPPPPEGDVTYTTFYDSLAPYGTWVDVSGYGRCWRPTIAVVNAGWSPYFDGGRWVYTDWGWYWVSDYSWGWAPFHYGRWFHHNHWGWCWAPDLVWGPAWVSWRYSGAYCGWAALPPGAYFSFGIGLTFHGRPCHGWDDWGYGHHHGRHFVAWRDFHRRGLHEYAVPASRHSEVYRETVTADRVALNNRTAINRGVPRERVAEVTRQDIQPVRVRETRGMAGRQVGDRPEQLRGNTLTVYRPDVNQQRRAETLNENGGNRNRPEGGNFNSAARAPSAQSSPSGRYEGAQGDNRQRSVTAPGNRTGNTVAREDRNGPPVYNRQQATTDASRRNAAGTPGSTSWRDSGNQNSRSDNSTRSTTRTITPLQSPAAAAQQERPSPVTRQPGSSTVTIPSQNNRPAPNRTQVSPQMSPQVPRPTGSSQAPAWSSSRSAESASRTGQAPGRPEVTRQQMGQSYQTSPRVTEVPRYAPAPTYTPQQSVTQPQRSSWAPVQNAPRQMPSVSQTPRYAPTQSAPSYSAPQRSYSAPQSVTRQTPTVSPAPRQSTPSYSAPQRSYSPPPSASPSKPSVSQAPRQSAPAMSAPRAPAAESRPAPAQQSRSESRSGGGNSGGGGRNPR